MHGSEQQRYLEDLLASLYPQSDVMIIDSEATSDFRSLIKNKYVLLISVCVIGRK